MYVPAYSAVDPAHVEELVRTWPFATVVTSGSLGLLATHVPLVLVRPDRLIGHLARPNPQLADLNGPVLAIFHGPHALVDPQWYREPTRQVPTWNYLAVHATGEARLLADPAPAVDALLAATGLTEARGPERQAFVEGLMRGIVAFEIAVSRWEAKAKLSQNRDADDHDRVRDALQARGEGQDRDVAAFMSRRLRSP